MSLDVEKMMKNKKKTVTGLTKGIEFLFKKNKTDYVKGFGKIQSEKSVAVDLTDGGSEVLEADNIIIATGSEVMPLPPVPVDNEKGIFVDSTGALDLKKVPESLIVIGGGYIGLEMGSVWRRLGSKVTVVEYADRIVPAMDQELGSNFQKILKKQGLNFMLSTKVVGSEVTGDRAQITIEPASGGEKKKLDADVVLVCTGRKANTE